MGSMPNCPRLLYVKTLDARTEEQIPLTTQPDASFGLLLQNPMRWLDLSDEVWQANNTWPFPDVAQSNI